MNKTIMIVDDDPVDVAFISTALRGAHQAIEIVRARDGVDALEQISAGAAPHIIIADLKMPRMDGLQFLERLRACDRVRDIPVIILSTASADEEVERSYRHHANAYIVKPSCVDRYDRVARSIVEFWLTAAATPRRAAG